MAQRVRDILLKVTGDASQAERELHDLARDLTQFDGTTATATVDVNTQLAEKKIVAAKSAVQDFGKLTAEAKIDLQTRAAEVKLAGLRTNLDNLQKKPTSPKVDIAIGATVAKIERVELALDRLDRRRVDVDVDVDRHGTLGRGIAGGIVGAFATVTQGIGSATQAVGGFVASVVASGPVAIAALVPIGVAVAALGASFATAAAGVAVLGVALAAAFGPVFLVGVAAMARLATVMKAVNAHGKQRKELLDQLTPQEQALVGVITKLKTALTTAFRPATNAVFAGLVSLLGDVADFAKDAGVRSGLRAVGTAIGSLFRAIGRETRRKEFRDAFKDFAEAGAKIVRGLTPVFRTMFRTITRLAQAALPWLIGLIDDVGKAISGWLGDTKKSGIEAFVKRVRHSFNIWIGIVKELVGIMRAFFGDANDSGDEFAEKLRLILRRLRIWLEQNPDKIQAFFDAVEWSAKAALTTVRAIVDAIKWIDEHKGPSLRDLADKVPTGPSGIDILKKIFGFQSGGVIPGIGSGDRIPVLAEPGEFMIRRSVAQAIGIPRLNLINSGRIDATPMRSGGVVAARAGGHITVGKIVLDVPGGGMLDATAAAVKLARVLERRGGGPRQ